MGSDNDTGPTVAPMTHRHLLRRRFAMHINQNRLRQATQRMRLQDLLHRRKWIVEGALHEDLAQHLCDQNLASSGRREQSMPPTRCGLGIIQWPNDTRFLLDIRQHFALVEGVVTKCDAIRPSLQQQFGMCNIQPMARSCILAIDHDKIETPFGS